jgi:RimJ/RimL family protein N-acetyltransferase
MIRGREVLLRPVEESDYPLIHRWMNHPEVWRNMDYEVPFSLLDVKEDIERSRKEGHPFTILVGDRPIGRIGLNQFRRRDRICSLYMYIGEPDYLGRGHAQDATMTLLAYAFDRWDLNQVELWSLADNNRAIGMYERCGFVQEGRLRDRSFKEGHWVDHVVMSVNREEFARAHERWGARRTAGLGETPGIVTQDSRAH